MIRNKLAELLSERQLKITKVAKDTGISRNTITSTSQNDTKMIQYETIDILCQYLGITPNDFFDFIPINYSLYCDSVDLVIDSEDVFQMETVQSLKYIFDLYVDIKTNSYEKSFGFEGYFTAYDLSEPNFEASYDVVIKFENPDSASEFKNNFYDKITAGHRTLFNKEVKEFIVNKYEETLEATLEDNVFLITNLADHLNFSKLPWV